MRLSIQKYYSFLWLITVLLFLYIYINNPIFTIFRGLGAIKLIYPFAFVFFLLKKNKILKFLYIYKKESIIFFFILLFTLLRALLGGDLTFFRIYIISYIEDFFVAFFIVYICVNKLSHINFSTIIIVESMIGAIITALCLFFPSFNFYVKESLLISVASVLETNIRGFGIADGLTYSYGITQGIALSLCFINLSRHKLYLLFIPLLLLSVFFNSRTGMVPPIVTLIYLLIFSTRESLIKTLLSMTLFILAFIMLIQNSTFYSENKETFKWAFDFFYQTSDFFLGTNQQQINSDNTFDVLLNTGRVLPENFTEWIIGSGKSFYFTDIKHTDVGYLLQLKYGGIIFISLLFSLFFTMVYRIKRLKNYKWFLFLFIFVTVICNVKGDFIPFSGGFRMLSLIYIYLISINSSLLSNDNYNETSCVSTNF